MRHRIFRSAPLRAWFIPKDELAIEYMLRLPDYEPFQWVSPKPGDLFIDVGGYVGGYTIHAAKAVGHSGRIVPMEPDHSNRRQLEANLSLNGVSNCTVVPLAAWFEAGEIGWHSDDVHVWRKVDQKGTSAHVRSATIDSLVDELRLQNVSWIKMDMEGAEIQALQGAEHVLRSFHPTLFIEVHETLEPVTRFLKGFGYTTENSTFDILPDHHGWILAR